ncbi:GstD1 family protein [Megaselia abdita]
MDFYYMPASAACRSVLMTAEAIGVKLNLKVIDLKAGDHLTPEFLAINPQHTVPTLVDDGFPLWESRSILSYLVDKYGKDDSLYPRDDKKRALVNQRLYFDSGVLYQRFGEYFYPQIFAKAPADPDKLKRFEEALGFLNTFLDGQTYVAGENLTIADLSIFAGVSFFFLTGIDEKSYTNIQRWYSHLKETVPVIESDRQCLEEARKWLENARK